jgi:hypothetical protein
VHLVYYAFDLLNIGGWNVSGLSLLERKTLLEPLVVGKPRLQYNGHDTGDGELILAHAGEFGFEAVVSKTIDAPYAPGNRGLWRKAKALNRQEFMVRQTTRQSTAGPGRSSPKRSRRHRRLTAPPIRDESNSPNPIMRLLHSWNSKMCRDETAGNREVVPVVQYLQPVRLGSARPVVGVDEMGHGLKAEEIRGGRRREEDVGR